MFARNILIVCGVLGYSLIVQGMEQDKSPLASYQGEQFEIIRLDYEYINELLYKSKVTVVLNTAEYHDENKKYCLNMCLYDSSVQNSSKIPVDQFKKCYFSSSNGSLLFAPKCFHIIVQEKNNPKNKHRIAVKGDIVARLTIPSTGEPYYSLSPFTITNSSRIRKEIDSDEESSYEESVDGSTICCSLAACCCFTFVGGMLLIFKVLLPVS